MSNKYKKGHRQPTYTYENLLIGSRILFAKRRLFMVTIKKDEDD
jgi:hypothetical protein